MERKVVTDVMDSQEQQKEGGREMRKGEAEMVPGRESEKVDEDESGGRRGHQ